MVLYILQSIIAFKEQFILNMKCSVPFREQKRLQSIHPSIYSTLRLKGEGPKKSIQETKTVAQNP